jgi:hypothetical protein
MAPWDAAIAVKNEAQHVDDTCGRFRVELPLDVEIAALADRQHGVVALRQLLEFGLSARAVQHRTARGRLHRIHRGVYAVGRSQLTGRGHWMAAGLRQDNRPRADVSLPSPSARPRKGIEVHSSVTLTAEDITTVDGIPCTTVARTLAQATWRKRSWRSAGTLASAPPR